MTDVCVIELPERLDIACVETLHAELETALSSGDTLELHGSKVSKLDTAGLQVLEAFYDEASKHHQEVKWIEPSSTILEVTKFLKLRFQLGLSDEEQERIDE